MELDIIKNMESASYHGSTYGQDVEPHGTYVLEKTPGTIELPGWVSGKANLNKPLIIDLDGYEDVIDYKRDLAKKYKAKGKSLTKKLMSKGYDSIVTRTKKYGTGEIVLFPNANFVLYQPQNESVGKKDKKINCYDCGWSWKEYETEPHDKYICHKCGNDTMKESTKNIVKTLLREMYYEKLKPLDKYVDTEDLIGQNLWFHTNRTHRNQGKNGMVGIYTTNSSGKKGNLANMYTNEVRLKGNIVFQTSESGANRIKKSKEDDGNAGTRQLIAGVSGTVVATDSGNTSGMSQVQYNPFDEAPWFYLIGDNDKREIISASEVYFVATEDGKWFFYVKSPVFRNGQLELF